MIPDRHAHAKNAPFSIILPTHLMCGMACKTFFFVPTQVSRSTRVEGGGHPMNGIGGVEGDTFRNVKYTILWNRVVGMFHNI